MTAHVNVACTTASPQCATTCPSRYSDAASEPASAATATKLAFSPKARRKVASTTKATAGRQRHEHG